MSSPVRREQGFTLIELVVSILVTAILVLGAMSVLVQQQRLLQTSSADRALQETARTALSEIGGNLRRAGFGIDPSLAFDFSSYACATSVQCRDSVTASDEIVFYARDPGFKASLAAAPTAIALSLTGGIQAPLRRGQILQVMCGGADEWTYVTVGTTVPANWTPPALPPATTAVPLAAATAAFPNQNARLAVATSCFQMDRANVRVYRVDRFRYYVATFTDAAAAGGLTRPYLMLDRGLLNDNGTSRAEPVAPDVEDVQFEYVFVDPTTMATRSVGATSGVLLTNAAGSVDLAAAPPALGARADDAARRTNSPANVRAVRVNVVVRTAGPDLAHDGRARSTGSQAGLIRTEGDAIPPAGNRPTTTGDNLHVRIRVDATYQARNMESRAPYYDP